MLLEGSHLQCIDSLHQRASSWRITRLAERWCQPLMAPEHRAAQRSLAMKC